MKYDFEIYTDGSCRGNPGPGGYGAIIVDNLEGVEYIINGGVKHTTNNIMELTAIIEALEPFKGSRSEIKLYSDSQYCISGITDWMSGWIKRGWKNAAKKPVANKDLWLKYLDVSEGLTIHYEWVKAHNGHPMNERVDTIAFNEASKF